MRWYWVPCLSASRLKKSTLRLDRAIVTFTPSSFSTKSSGLGKKSGMTFSFPSGSFVYLIFALINSFSFAPISGANDADDALAIREAYRHDPLSNLPNTIVSLLGRTVHQILGDDALGINKRELRLGEGHTVFRLVFHVLLGVPLETGFGHAKRLARIWMSSHMTVWLFSLRTEDAYLHWIRRFIFFHGTKHPREMGSPQVQAFLSHLATGARVAASTQNQVLSASLFLCREVLQADLPWLDGVVRPTTLALRAARPTPARLRGAASPRRRACSLRPAHPC